MNADDRRKPATLRDVAAIVGVDPSVISRFVNQDSRLSISAETEQRVIEALEETGYQPNRAAKALRLGKTLLLGLLVPDFANPVYAELILGAQTAAEEAGYGLLLGSPSDAEPADKLLDQLLAGGRVDGVLYASASSGDPVVAQIANDRRVIVLNRLIPAVHSVVVGDDRRGASLAADHLLSLGHKRFGVVAGPETVETSHRRYEGFAEKVLDAGLDRPAVAFSDRVSFEGGRETCLRLLDANPSITAIFSTTLVLSLGVMSALRLRGISCPDDLSLVGFNDAPIAELVSPPLTAVAMPYRALGEQGAKRLIESLEGQDQGGTVVVSEPPPNFVVRGSTAQAK